MFRQGATRRGLPGIGSGLGRVVSPTPWQVGRGTPPHGAFLRGGFEARRVERLDFVSQRPSLTVGDGRIARRRSPADVVPRLDRDRREARRRQRFANLSHIVIAMRGAGQEARRILRIAFGERLGHPIGELVFGDLVPYIEKEAAAGLHNAVRHLEFISHDRLIFASLKFKQ